MLFLIMRQVAHNVQNDSSSTFTLDFIQSSCLNQFRPTIISYALIDNLSPLS